MHIEEAISVLSEDLFNEFSMLESFSWIQYINEDGDFQVESNDFTINEEAYWGENSIWKQDVSNYLRNAFDEFAPEDLQNLYGSNVKVTITRDETITSPYFLS